MILSSGFILILSDLGICMYPLATGCKLNIHTAFRRCRLLNNLWMFNVRLPVFKGYLCRKSSCTKTPGVPSLKADKLQCQLLALKINS